MPSSRGSRRHRSHQFRPWPLFLRRGPVGRSLDLRHASRSVGRQARQARFCFALVELNLGHFGAVDVAPQQQVNRRGRRPEIGEREVPRGGTNGVGPKLNGRRAELADFADVLAVGIPSHAMRETLGRIADELRPWVPAISLAKGLEPGTRRRPTEVIADCLPGHPVGLLAGPNIAGEIAEGKAAAAVIVEKRPQTNRADAAGITRKAATRTIPTTLTATTIVSAIIIAARRRRAARGEPAAPLPAPSPATKSSISPMLAR